jgi:hypothetical protein
MGDDGWGLIPLSTQEQEQAKKARMRERDTVLWRENVSYIIQLFELRKELYPEKDFRECNDSQVRDELRTLLYEIARPASATTVKVNYKGSQLEVPYVVTEYDPKFPHLSNDLTFNLSLIKLVIEQEKAKYEADHTYQLTLDDRRLIQAIGKHNPERGESEEELELEGIHQVDHARYSELNHQILRHRYRKGQDRLRRLEEFKAKAQVELERRRQAEIERRRQAEIEAACRAARRAKQKARRLLEQAQRDAREAGVEDSDDDGDHQPPRAASSVIANSNTPHDICSICMEKYNGTNIRRSLLVNCGHIHCELCIAKWKVEQQITCPTCRDPMY